MALNNTSIKQLFKTAYKYFQAGDFRKAENICLRIRAAEPENPHATYLLGQIAHQHGELDIAAQLLSQAIRGNPNNSLWFFNLGNICLKLGNLQAAEDSYKRALSIKPDYGEALNNLGVTLQDQNKLIEAITIFQQALQLKPAKAGLYNNLGHAFKKLGKLADAEESFKKALVLEPDSAETYNNLGIVFEQLGKMADAEESLRKALMLQSGSAEAYNNLGVVLQKRGKLSETIAVLNKSLSLKPDNAEAQNNLGITLQALGRTEEAIEAFKRALAVKPDFAYVYRQLAYLINQSGKKSYYHPEHEDIKKINILLDRSDITDENSTYLHLALGEIYDNCTLYDVAFQHVQHANRIKNKTSAFNIDQYKKRVDEIISVFSNDVFAQPKFKGSSSTFPVFIVGLPRSGKTLVENMLAAHEDVYGGRELTEITRLIHKKIPHSLGVKTKFPIFVRGIDSKTAKIIIAEYESFLQNVAEKPYKRITNTFTNSFLLLGLIALLFPKSRIIYCRRSPLDNCLAIFFKLFKPGYEYSYDLSHIGFMYRQYEKLMDYWKNTLPIPIYELQYNELVKKPEQLFPQLISFLELEWNKQCTDMVQDLIAKENAERPEKKLTEQHPRGIGWASNYKRFVAPLEESL